MIPVQRNFLELKDLKNLRTNSTNKNKYLVKKIKPDFQLNKFFYKNIGKNHHWIDRLVWTDKQWADYVFNEQVKTFILKKRNDLAGYFELIFHKDKSEIEIAYLGLLEEYQNQKLGSFLLTEAIKNSFLIKAKRVWVHTCSLDHKNAIKNYLARGMQIFKSEKINIEVN